MSLRANVKVAYVRILFFVLTAVSARDLVNKVSLQY